VEARGGLLEEVGIEVSRGAPRALMMLLILMSGVMVEVVLLFNCRRRFVIEHGSLCYYCYSDE
jgi:hypothetical protein